ncbi:MAG TPA: ATP-binding protein [Candidatus Syntrophoarchaeum butanivorans]|uniref:ATP-binding protein n=1 Tax=Candidatus Syntropharchaeum butanivorans TaxID=1839936 RepID=A0A1F2P375_9EURY|nr:MAG: ATPase AAA [Candidatus Syntrophoarchaeum butanivorans]HEC56833.1 ATP-binding protein [Candidatus Syntrophoarchaeum butanivorans]
MKPFHLVAIPHRDILEGRLTMDVFAADLWEVFQQRAVEDYQNPEVFFRKTYLTSGLKDLLKITQKRLGGEGGDPVIQIQTPFGGGKTHALIALYHAFTNPEVARKYVSGVVKANTVVIVGTAISPKEEDGNITGTIWGEIEKQLEGEIKELNTAVSPGREKLRELLSRHQPLLILMDEVLEYVTKAAGIRVEDSKLSAQTMAFLQELTETVKTLDRTLLVITLPSSIIEHYDESAERLFLQLQKVSGRMEKIYTPVAGEEIYEVIRRRLFREVDLDAAREIVNEYIDYYDKEGILQLDKAEYRNKLLRSYPFHPEVIDVLHRRWGSIPTFQRTRGVLRILSLAVYRLKDSSIPLIRPCDFDLSFSEISEELIKHIGREFESVLSADITSKDANAKKVDKSVGMSYQGLNLGTKLATAVFLYSFSGGEKGVTLGELKLACADPNVPSSVTTEIADGLKNSLFYIQHDGGRYFFTSQPNLNSILVTRMSEIENGALKAEIKSLVERYADKAIATYIWPRNPKDVPDTEDFKLVILPSLNPDFCKELLENYGENPRVNKNTLFFLCPMESERIGFENWVRRRLAWQSIADDRTLNLTDNQRKDVTNNLKDMKKNERIQLRSFYRLVYVPARDDLKEIDLGIPVFGETKTLSKEVLDRLKVESEIVEKLSPILITERYLGSKDYLEIKQLYKSLLTTPGEPRIPRQNFIRSLQEGVEQGIFGFGTVKDGVECLKFKETPSIHIEEYEAIVRKELCEKPPEPPEVPPAGAGDESKGVITPPPPTSPTPQPRYCKVALSVRIPKGKFSEFYQGVIRTLENSFEETDIKIEIVAGKGTIAKGDYENKIKETLFQINAKIEEESFEGD